MNESIDWFKTLVVGAALTCALSFIAWLGVSVNAMADRLTAIEVTMRENKEERLQQIADLRARVGRLEDERAQRFRSDRREEKE